MLFCSLNIIIRNPAWECTKRVCVYAWNRRKICVFVHTISFKPTKPLTNFLYDYCETNLWRSEKARIENIFFFFAENAFIAVVDPFSISLSHSLSLLFPGVLMAIITAAATSDSHTQDYRMLNKYIIWLYTARVRMFFMRFIFTYTFLSLPHTLTIPMSHIASLFIFLSVKYCVTVAERTWKTFFYPTCSI
jgi:hypothetical protein